MGSCFSCFVVVEVGVDKIKYDCVKLIFAFIFKHTIYIYST